MTTPIDLLLTGWRHNLETADRLLDTIPGDRMTRQPHGVVNHPAWTLGHLIHYHRPILDLAHGRAVGDPAKFPDADRFDAGSTPVDDPAQYPAKDELWSAYRAGHERVVEALSAAPADLLDQPPGLDRWAAGFGSTAAALSYLMVYHEATHLGEVMAWRRAMGQAPLE